MPPNPDDFEEFNADGPKNADLSPEEDSGDDFKPEDPKSESDSDPEPEPSDSESDHHESEPDDPDSDFEDSGKKGKKKTPAKG